MKKILRDPGIWILLAANLYILFYYFRFPNSIHTVIALFWVQSVLIGVFNALDIFTLTHTVDKSFTFNRSTKNSKGCAGLFFLLHYGFFHAVYLVFLVSSVIDRSRLDWNFMILSFWLLLASSVAGFVQNKLRNRTEAVNIGNMFFMPYARIVPMHLVILIPAFVHISTPLIFIVLKTVADLIMYIVYQRVVFRPISRNHTS